MEDVIARFQNAAVKVLLLQFAQEVEAKGRRSRHDCSLVPSCKFFLCFLSAFSVAAGVVLFFSSCYLTLIYPDRPCISSILSSLCFTAATLIFSHLVLGFCWNLRGGKRIVSLIRFFATFYFYSVERASIIVLFSARDAYKLGCHA